IRATGATAVVAPEQQLANGNFQTDLGAMLRLVDDQTAVIFVANPSNPTGTMVDLDALHGFLRQLPRHVLFVLDAAYAEYVADETYSQAVMDMVAQYPNLVVVRTFSKIYGMASLRLGFAYGHRAVIKNINKLCNVFSTSQVAQDAGVAALGDQDFVAQSRQKNKTEKERVQSVLRQQGFTCHPSETNFFIIDFGQGEAGKTKAEDFLRAMEDHNIFVRGLKSYHLLHMVRVTVGTKEENDIFLQWATAWATAHG
ncbi:MAG: histidinol-phosphate transaminase, partial [Alphaproteobacteria bacterium]|nr:histidinol-phosphate transaminase [Alphaproteobacteria bacterium]